MSVLQVQLRKGLVHRRLEAGESFLEYGDRSGEGGQMDWADLRHSQDGGYAGTNIVPNLGVGRAFSNQLPRKYV